MMKRTFIGMGASLLLLLFLLFNDSQTDTATANTATSVNTSSVDTGSTATANRLDGTWVTVVQGGLRPQEVAMVISNNTYKMEVNGNVQAEGTFEIVDNQMVSNSESGNFTYDFEMAEDGQSFTLNSAMVYQKKN